MDVRRGVHTDKEGVCAVIMSRVGFHTTKAVVRNRVEQMVNRSRRRPRESMLLVAWGGRVDGFAYAERTERFELFTAEEEAIWWVQYVGARPCARAGRVYVALLRAMKERADAPLLCGAWTHRALQGGEGQEKLGRLYARLGMRQVATAWEW